MLLLRLGVLSTDTSDRHRPPPLVRPPTPPARSTMLGDERFFIYLVDSSEAALLLQSWFSGTNPDTSPGTALSSTVRVVATPAEAALFFADLVRTNSVRSAAGFPEIQLVDLRARPP